MIAKRVLGRTGLEVSTLGFGCGAVGGLLVAGTVSEQKAAVAQAGISETNLGRVLRFVARAMRSL